MPRAKDNRKPVGTEKCVKCGEEAEFYQVQKGRYMGYLYRKGCECKADQRTMPYVQLEWLQRMARTPHPMMPHPLTQWPEKGGEEGETPEEPAPKPETHEPEPRASTEGSGETPSKRGAILGGLILVGGIAAALLT